MDCPRCKLINPVTARWCDCGYDFGTKTIDESHITVRPKMKHQGLYIFVWFSALAILNIATHWFQNTNDNALAHFLEANGTVIGVFESFLTTVVIIGIVLSNRKPMADR